MHTVAIDTRLSQLQDWLRSVLSTELSIDPVLGDCSFRRYFRVKTARQSYIAMDAPPARENCAPFIAIATAFQRSAVRLPIIFHQNVADGFLLLSDFGDQHLLKALQTQDADALYSSALTDLLSMQTHPNHYSLPMFDATLFWKEFDIFDEWYLQKNKKIILSECEVKKLRALYQLLIDSALSQPQVFVHRDYHSRNIMICDDGRLGFLDFQDAVIGPIAYDCVSLLRDCYVTFPEKKVEQWARDFYQSLALTQDFKVFMRWFDWMGLQRHLKCLGIFSRMALRNQKPQYLSNIPRVLRYIHFVCDRYPELQALKYYS
ncbi:MAG TPA: phosphotransferase [Coxiellaceae bacterium]|nr:phosphotransferase [Coxiellaceae bacterium]